MSIIVTVLHVTLHLVDSASMAESGIDLTFDNQMYDRTGNTSDTSPSSMMAHLQPLSMSSG